MRKILHYLGLSYWVIKTLKRSVNGPHDDAVRSATRYYLNARAVFLECTFHFDIRIYYH